MCYAKAIPPRSYCREPPSAIDDQLFLCPATFRSQVITCFQKSQQWQHAITVLQSLQHPDDFNYGGVAHACVKSSSWVAALTLTVGMKHRALETNTVLRNTLTDGLAQASGWERPLDHVMAMRHDGISYNQKSFGSAFTSSWEQVFQMLSLARRQHLRTDMITSGAALHVLKAAMPPASSWQRSLDFLHCMGGDGMSPNQVCMTSASASCKDWQHALALQRWSASCSLKPARRLNMG